VGRYCTCSFEVVDLPDLAIEEAVSSDRKWHYMAIEEVVRANPPYVKMLL
jgi:hypothetical protein